MTRVRAIQLGVLAAAVSYAITFVAMRAFTHDETVPVNGDRPAGSVAPAAIVKSTPASSKPSGAGFDTTNNLRQTNDVHVYNMVKDSVVNITSTHTITGRIRTGVFALDNTPLELMDPQLRQQLIGKQISQSLGSGFVIHPAGYIITNEHVIEQGTDIQCVFTNGEKLTATVIATDNEHDLAVIKVNPKDPLPALVLGASEDLMIGEPVYAIGNPFGFTGTMTRGIVSAVNRTLDVSEDKSYKNLVQTDASINPGNSGGPLLNAYGQVIGINTAIRADAHGIGFAIAVSDMRELLPTFLSPEALSRAEIGFTVEEVRSSSAPANVSSTVIIKQVLPGSAAAQAGLQPGDQLLSIGGKPVTNIVDALVPMATVLPGDKLKLELTHLDKKTTRESVELFVTLPPIPASPDEILAARLGIKAEAVTAAMAARFKLPVTQGIYLTSVDPRSPAGVKGLEAGDLLVQVGTYYVNSPADVAAVLKSGKGSYAVTVVRGNLLGHATLNPK